MWPIPVILCPPNDVAAKIQAGQKIALQDSQGRLLGLISVTEKYRHDKELEIPNVYRTSDEAHPGVAQVKKQGDTCIAGSVDVIQANHEPEFPEYRLPPAKTREAFAARGWNTVAAFQTRNPIHRSHEYLTKCALEMTDGLLIHPLVGETKSDDIPADVRMQCYKVADRQLLQQGPHDADGDAAGHALRRAARGDFAFADPQELRRDAFHRRPRPCRRGELLRNLRCPENLRSVRCAARVSA